MTFRFSYTIYTISNGQFHKVLVFDKFKLLEELELIIEQEEQFFQTKNHCINIKRLDNKDWEDTNQNGSMEIYSEKANVLSKRVWGN